MKYVYFIAALLFLQVRLFSQNAQLTGKVTDLDTIPQLYTTVKLVSKFDTVTNAKVSTGETGIYRFSNIPYGRYFLVVESPAFENETSETFELNSDSLVVFDVVLSKTKQLKEVTVKGQRSLVRLEDGKTIVSVENTVGNSGQTAIEILRKAPGVAVDQNGNVQLNGKGGVQIMIDDKLMYLGADALANLLKAIPSEQIKEIELNSNPSAKYDAAGTGGIINIKLKKGAYEGFTGRFNATFGYGLYRKSSIGTNLTYKKKKLTLNANYQYSDRIGWSTFSSERVDNDASIENNQLYNKSDYKSPSLSHNFQVTGDYKVNKATSVNFDFNNTYSDNGWLSNSSSELKNQSSQLVNSFTNVDKGTFYSWNSYSSIGFQHTFDTLGTKLSGFAGFNRNNGDVMKHQQLDTYDGEGNNLDNPLIFDMKNNLFSNHFLGQLDFVKTISKVKFETGAKANNLFLHNPNAITIVENGSTTLSDNTLDFEERILAVYLMGTRKLNKWNVQGGLRLENTVANAGLTRIDTSYTRNYTNLFPTGAVSYKQSEKTSYSLTYSRRITRPTGEQLNPVLHILDPFTVRSGDPYLLPVFANNTELTYSILGGTVIAAVNYTYIKNPIAWVNKYDPSIDKFVSGIRNLDQQDTYGASVSYNKQLVSWWSTTNNAFAGYNVFKGDAGFGDVLNQSMWWTLKTTQRFNFAKSYSLELFGTYEGPSSYGFAKYTPRSQVNVALQKKVLKNKGLIKIAANDIFWGYYYEGNTRLGNTIDQHTNFKWDNRTFILSFNYRFGNPLMKSE